MSLSEFEKGMIVAFRESGWSYGDIAERLSRSKSCISVFYSSYEKSGSIEQKSGRGRKRKTSERDDHAIVIAAKRQRTITSTEIKQNICPHVSEKTIRRRLNENGFFSYFQVKKPFISKKNQKLRLKFALKYRHKPIEFWRSVLWSDESPFTLRFNGRIRIWRLPNERYAPYCLRGTVKHDKKINIWGCFSAHGVGRLYMVNGILDQYQFNNILERQMIPSAKKLFPDGDFIFQQDNDPKHRADINQHYLADENIQLLDWPSQSPDLNPIENLWSIIDKNIKNRNPTDEIELFNIIKTSWESLTVDLLSRLVDSMPARCEAVIQNNGMPTKY
jgi:transposase